jgi:TRAP-type C4-dicarboxylate transport system permease small subunit
LFEVTLGLLFVVHGAQLIRTVSNTLPGLGIGASSQYVPALVGGVLIVIFALEKLFAPASEDSNRAPEGANNG